MRDNIANSTIPTKRSSLEVVRNQFEVWRKRRPCRGPIPEALWEAAVGLCGEHSIFEVCRVLRVNYNGLKDRVLRAGRLDPLMKPCSDIGFVKLDMGSPKSFSECWVEMEAPGGSRMRISFKGSLRDFDPVGLSQVFWRQG